MDLQLHQLPTTMECLSHRKLFKMSVWDNATSLTNTPEPVLCVLESWVLTSASFLSELNQRDTVIKTPLLVATVVPLPSCVPVVVLLLQEFLFASSSKGMATMMHRDAELAHGPTVFSRMLNVKHGLTYRGHRLRSSCCVW